MNAAQPAVPQPSFQVRGSVFRAYLKFLEAAGMSAAVREGVPARTQAAMDKPPFVLAWVSSDQIEDLYGAVQAISGIDGVRRLTHEATRSQVGPLLRPLIQGAMKLVGTTPSSVFSELNSIAAPALNGIRFTWTPSTESSGELLVQHSAPSSEIVYHAWAGTLSYVWDVCEVEGAIEFKERMPDGCSARLGFHWKQRAQ